MELSSITFHQIITNKFFIGGMGWIIGMILSDLIKVFVKYLINKRDNS